MTVPQMDASQTLQMCKPQSPLGSLRGGLLCDSYGLPVTQPLTPAYGAMVSHYREPVDQIAAFLIAKEIQNHAPKSHFFPYTSIRFSLLNRRKKESLRLSTNRLKRAAIQKQLFHLAVMRHFNIKGLVLFSDGFWEDPAHWKIAEKLLERYPEIIPASSPFNGSFYKFSEVSKSYKLAIPSSLMEKVGSIEAPKLYPLLEATHLKYLAVRYKVNAKLGPESESKFDEFMKNSTSILHFRQPVDLPTAKTSSKTVIPYIGKRTQTRIFFGLDTEATIASKLRVAEQSWEKGILPDNEMSRDGCNPVHPIVQYAIYAVETARLRTGSPVKLGGRQASDGLEVLELAQKKDKQWAPDVAKALWENLLRPINMSVEREWNLKTQLARAKKSK